MAPTTATTPTTEARELRTAGASRPGRLRSLPGQLGRGRRRGPGLRARILAWHVGLLALAALSSILVAREVLLLRLDQAIDADLVQEAQELRSLASGSDPQTGEPFEGRARRIFEYYLERNIPSRHEALLTFVAGEPFLRSRTVDPYRLDQDPELVARWSTLAAPDRGSVDTPAGRVEYLAVPLTARGETRGVFVAAIFRDRAWADSDSAVKAAGAVGFAVLLIGSILAWRLADRVLVPVGAVTRTARSISESDLARRIPVDGSDEIAQLAATFNDMLDRLERAFSTQRSFIDDAGHELRTPITIARGHLELLKDGVGEQPETVALVLDELGRMGRMVDDLLVLARWERPDFLALETVEVETLSEELQAKAEALAPGRWTLAERGRGRIVADRQRLTQAVMQLAENAVAYGGEGALSLGSRVEEGSASFWVRDSGPGIPAAEREHVFERFRRGSARRRSGGAGLGLSIVKAIAEAHGGRVEVATPPGGGAQLTIVVPTEQPGSERDGRGEL